MADRKQFWAAFHAHATRAGFPGHWNRRTSIRHREGLLSWVIRVRDDDGEAELLIEHGSRESNAALFRQLKDSQAAIARSYGTELVWEDVPGRRRFRVAAPTRAAGVKERRVWRCTWDDLLVDMFALEHALRPYLRVVNLTDSWPSSS